MELKEERKTHQESARKDESEETKLNLGDAHRLESTHNNSTKKNSNNPNSIINQLQSNYSNFPKKKECGCESTVLIVDDNFFNLLPLELILRETFGI